MKIFIAIPSLETVPALFCQSLALLQRAGDTVVGFEVGSLVYEARNKLAREAIRAEADYVLWLDSDMIFNDSLLDDLMFSGKPFVTGIAHARRAPHVSCIFREIWPKVDRWDGHDYPITPFRIGGCGFACVLIETDIIRNVYNKNGSAFFPMRELGEDLAFCKRAIDIGYEIWAEPTVKLGHIGHITIYPEYEGLYRQSIQGIEDIEHA